MCEVLQHIQGVNKKTGLMTDLKEGPPSAADHMPEPLRTPALVFTLTEK